MDLKALEDPKGVYSVRVVSTINSNYSGLTRVELSVAFQTFEWGPTEPCPWIMFR